MSRRLVHALQHYLYRGAIQQPSHEIVFHRILKHNKRTQALSHISIYFRMRAGGAIALFSLFLLSPTVPLEWVSRHSNLFKPLWPEKSKNQGLTSHILNLARTHHVRDTARRSLKAEDVSLCFLAREVQQGSVKVCVVFVGAVVCLHRDDCVSNWVRYFRLNLKHPCEQKTLPLPASPFSFPLLPTGRG